MFKRRNLAIIISLLMLLSAVACEEILIAPPGQTPQPSATAESPGAASPTPFVDTDDNPPNASPAVMTTQEDVLTTPEVVKLLAPSVVQIATQTVTTGLFSQPVPSQGVGTGIILDETGRIMTNNHVVDGAQTITVTLHNGDNYTASIVGTDGSTDLAVIHIEADGLIPARLGVSAELEVGEDVIAIGQALGLPGGPTVTKGVVSALGRTIDIDAQTTMVDLIQTDAEINPGNSGGPLANTSGEVIGINTAIIQSGRGIGFAINIDDAKQVVTQLLESGFVNRGFLGVTPATLTPGLANRYNLPVDEGILITRVIRGGGLAAEEAGLREGDVIVEMDGVPLRNTGELFRFLLAHPPGETISVVYYRGAIRNTVDLTLSERPR